MTNGIVTRIVFSMQPIDCVPGYERSAFLFCRSAEGFTDGEDCIGGIRGIDLHEGGGNVTGVGETFDERHCFSPWMWVAKKMSGLQSGQIMPLHGTCPPQFPQI